MKKDPYLFKLGRNIAKIRGRNQISQDQMALEADIGRRTVHRLETGDSNPKYLTLLKIANCLGVEVKDLVDVDKK